MKIKIINEQDMKKIIDMPLAIEAVKEAAILYSSGETNIPLRTNLNIKEYNGDSLYMYGYIKKSKALGIKLVSVFPDNAKKGLNSCPASVILENVETGEVKCIMNGTYLTKLRTGALSGLATDILARKDASTFTIVGSGGQSDTQVLGVLATRNIKEINIYSRNIEHAKALVDRMRNELANISSMNLKTQSLPIFNAFGTDTQVKTDADIVTCVTTSLTPVIDGKSLKPGTHVNAVGSYTPDMSEIDEYTVINADKIIVDTMDGTINETGDFLKPISNEIFSKEKITGELGNLSNGTCPGRTNDNELTLFETTGSAVFDLVTAEKIYELAIEKDIGQFIEI